MVEVGLVAGQDLAEPLKLLELSVRDGEPVTPGFAGSFREEMEQGRIEVLAARLDGAVVGVAVLSFRPSVSASGLFASIEELYVKPEVRRRGVGQTLLENVGKRCALRGISYVEVQTVEEAAIAFYEALGYEPESEVVVLSRSVALREDG